MKKQKGITLVALVITIIVLLILAGVAINSLSGENGILNKAVDAKEETRIAKVEEEINMWKLEWEEFNYAGGDTPLSEEEFIEKLKSSNSLLEDEIDTITKTITIENKTISYALQEVELEDFYITANPIDDTKTEIKLNVYGNDIGVLKLYVNGTLYGTATITRQTDVDGNTSLKVSSTSNNTSNCTAVNYSEKFNVTAWNVTGLSSGYNVTVVSYDASSTELERKSITL